MNFCTRILSIAATAALTISFGAVAQAAPITFSKLTGGTADSVFKADLSTAGLASFTSLTISDSGVIGGSAPGEFSGLDLDVVIISSTDCASASCAAALASDVIFDYEGSIFSPGTQTSPTNPKLFGTNLSGTGVDNSIATLGTLDGVPSVITPNGFISLGINGSIEFIFVTAIAASAPLFVYIGEVGANGELAFGSIEIFMDPISDVPIPAALPLFMMGLGALGFKAKRKKTV